MGNDALRPVLGVVSLVTFAAVLAAVVIIEFRERWMVDALLIAAGVAVGPAVVIAGRAVGPGRDSNDRRANAVLAAAYIGFVVVSAYNAFVLEFMTGQARNLTMFVIGMMGPATVLAASRALGVNDPLAAD
ncbi:hypothetical protein [Halococcus agarilyticus]|uniref:hypothetical protein n=1 Tax=Halococcus agarilyticus TaxID=1232219 RepID=UPI000677ADB8|nr:hypothetical protein [Halococcus agarilyticus]